MGTRGIINVPYAKQLVFDELLKCCEALKISFEKAQNRIDLKFALGMRYHIVLEREQGGGTIVQVLSEYDVKAHRKLIENMFAEFAKQMNLNSQLKLETGEYKQIQSISSEKDLKKACNVCSRNVYSFEFHMQNLCSQCFETKYGKLLLVAESTSYYGGHKKYLAGGMFSKEQSGKMYMTEQFIIFAKRDKDPYKRWEIVIPLTSISTEKWGIEEQIRRKQIIGGGTTITDDIAIGSGVIHETGKEHHLVVVYTDENGIPHAPRFGVSSFGGKAIRKWAATLYDAVVKAKLTQEVNQKSDVVDKVMNDDPIKILKIRLAKGEISKQEYEEMRNLL